MNSADILKQIEQDWQKTRPEIDTRPIVSVLAILRTAMAVQRQTEVLFSKYGLNTATFGVLATLRRSAPPKGMMLSQLADFVLVTRAAITNRVDRLEKRGLVERCSVKYDRRAYLIRLTPVGKDMIDEILPIHVENERQLLMALDDEEQRLLDTLLLKLVSGIEEQRSE